ncbi:MAG TPA: RNA polymerase sigma factor [Polyangiales bacterium]|nr:RNA polymerase sigma factor [Polyangiales bacterium]
MQAHTAVQTDPGACAQPIDAETLYRAHAPFVASFLRHMGTREADLDDCLQDVFVIAHRKGGYQPGPAAPRTWLASLAFRVVLGRRRARARRPEAPATLEPSDEAASPADVLEARRSLQRVQAALEELSLEHRAAFVLHDIEGESCERIAVIWDVPVGTIYSRLHHARKRFAEAYGRSGR